MKEAFISTGPVVEIRDSPIPKPGPKQVVIKVEFSGSNPKDWKISDWWPETKPFNEGDDISGTVHEVGEDVIEFKPGDRVAAFHEMRTAGGSYAEYAVAHDHTTFHLPASTSFQAGAAIPLAAMTAVIGLYGHDNLALPQPTTPADEAIPLVIYGASSAVGSYALQFARRSNIHPLICVAGRAQAHVEKLIDRSKGDTIVDYREGSTAVAEGIRNALKGQSLRHAYDAISEHGSFQTICQVLEPKGRITVVLPGKDYSDIPSSMKKSNTAVHEAHTTKKDLAFVFSRLITRGLDEGWFQPQPQEIVPGGLGGIQGALVRLRDGKASAVKYVFKISDTPGVGA